jgi:Protein of unknown function (DUF3738).
VQGSIAGYAAQVVLALLAIQGIAQTATSTPASAPTRFDVVSIHLSDPSMTTEDLNYEQGQIICKGITLPFLVQSAYGIRPFQLSGIPRSLDSQKYDIDAKLDDPSKERPANELTPDLLRARSELDQIRLQAILKERFHLKLHTATKIGTVFVLSVSKNDPKLQKSSKDGGYMRMHGLGTETQIEAKNETMSDFAEELAYVVSNKVVDRTGLTDRYDFSVKWTSSQTIDPNATGPSLYTALEEQLGLKLKTERGPVEMYVVDHIEPPSPN